MANSEAPVRAWWKEGVCYQVWPLSFKDSNGDGMGDLQGIIGKLDYLKELGVDFIWMSPMYASPRDDYGYDIANYEDVDPVFGTLQDLDDLIAALRSRGMRLILDLVVNHTSSEHRWFKESSKSKDNEFSNYYIWKDPKIVDGKKCPPNNWRSPFGGSAWVYVESRDQYYLHLFFPTMPDLNWEDATVRQAIHKSAIEFWLKRGVAGFRVDVVNLYSKDTSYPDAPVTDPSEEFQIPADDMVVNGPRMHEWLQEQRRETLDKYGSDVFLVGELGIGSLDHLKKYLSPVNRELDTIFDFEINKAGGADHTKPWPEWVDKRSLLELRRAIMKPQSFLSENGHWPTTFLENHDMPRSISQHGSRDAKFRWQSGKLLALLLASMSGTLFIYQGQEIGMSNLPRDWPVSDLRDDFSKAYFKDCETKYNNDPAMVQKAHDVFDRVGRDHSRSPVQWSSEEPYAGFSTAQPWMRIHENFREGVNVKDQVDDPNSLLTFWQKVVAFRKSQPNTMIYGHTDFIDNENENIFSVIKRETSKGEDGARLLIVLNYSDQQRPFPHLDAELNGKIGQFMFGTGPGSDTGELQPWEGRVFEVSKHS